VSQAHQRKGRKSCEKERLKSSKNLGNIREKKKHSDADVVGADARCHGRDVSLSLIRTRWLFPLRDAFCLDSVTVASGQAAALTSPVLCSCQYLTLFGGFLWTRSPECGVPHGDPEVPESQQLSEFQPNHKPRMDQKYISHIAWDKITAGESQLTYCSYILLLSTPR